jgi:hypothetical protein
MVRLYSHYYTGKKKMERGRKATAKSLKPISMRYGSAFVQFTSNPAAAAAAVKGELRMYFQLKKWDKDRAKLKSEGDRERWE